MTSRNLVLILAVCFILSGFLVADDKNKTDTSDKTVKTEKGEKKDELTLKELFPKKSFFGPSANRMAFSHDGKYAAYLYRPYNERRHGADLFIYDVKKGEINRITSATVMTDFQKSTRKVCEDREKKAKALKKKKTEEAEKKEGSDEHSKEKKTSKGAVKNEIKIEKKEHGKEHRIEKAKLKDSGAVEKGKDEKSDKKKKEDKKDKKLGDIVGDKDADDEKAPRYSGIRSYTWSPKTDELLFTSEGDIYRYKIGDKKPIRLTRTKNSERSVTWLHDASGYIFSRNDEIIKVKFNSHFVEQLTPRLPSGEKLSRTKISPDGACVVFTTSKEGPEPSGGQKKVTIASYKSRFMKAREVSRQVSDDPMKKRTISVYYYEMDEHFAEKSEPVKVFEQTLTQPRDFVNTPRWSLDSKRMVFCSYDQTTNNVRIMQAIREIPDKKLKKDKEKDLDKGKKENKGEEDKKDGKKTKDKQSKEKLAKEVYKFLHNGGPTTPSMIQPYYLADNKRILFLSELSGFRHLHILDPIYQALEPLTKGLFEVYPINISKDHKWIFVSATKERPFRQDIYKISLDTAKMERISTNDGNYSYAAVSEDGKKALANFVSYGKLKELVFIDSEAKIEKTLTDSHPKKAKKLTKAVPEFFSYKNRHGHDIYGHMFKPKDLKKEDKQPLLIYIYGGPLGTRKQVTEGSYSSSSYFFANYMTEKHGYITCTIDPRGNSGYGALFEKANFKQVGKPQVEDIVDCVKFFIAKHGVDPKKVGIHGWSFGGFQTQMCLYTEPDVFAAGIAGAGPTEWENYNSWYTSATIGISKPGSAELKEFSLLPLAKNLKSKLLLVHGVEDSNVLYQDTVRVYRELLKAGKETLVELFLDPTGGHSLRGDVQNLGRYRKYEEFLLRTVGDGKKKQALP